jgi:large subunit ribosomal protein L21
VYAIVETGGKQYRVSEGATLYVEKLPGEPESTVELDKVLLIQDGESVRVGTPYIDGARVVATVVKQAKAPKILVFKYKPKKNYRKRYGHRQPYTALRIERIEG